LLRHARSESDRDSYELGLFALALDLLDRDPVSGKLLKDPCCEYRLHSLLLIFSIVIRCQRAASGNDSTGKLSLVDLAGSERVQRSEVSLFPSLRPLCLNKLT